MTSFFTVKAWLGASGVAVGLLGIATERHWLVWIAAGLLGLAFLLRFAERGERDL